ncbi:MAG: hypothetical protein H0W13_04635, partial [Nitrospirales bacterium]|nr:hypothetical protein [Nitrospirales bacterium]
DGGGRWIDRTLPCLRTCSRLTDLLRVRFTDPKSGWVVGEHGAIYRTTDAGFSWFAEDKKTTQSLYGLTFPDHAHGWASGERGTIVYIATP